VTILSVQAPLWLTLVVLASATIVIYTAVWILATPAGALLCGFRRRGNGRARGSSGVHPGR
jgi:hypothetical protein